MSDLRELLTPDVLDRLCNVICDGVFDGPEEMNEAMRAVLVSALAPLVEQPQTTHHIWCNIQRGKVESCRMCSGPEGLHAMYPQGDKSGIELMAEHFPNNVPRVSALAALPGEPDERKLEQYLNEIRRECQTDMPDRERISRLAAMAIDGLPGEPEPLHQPTLERAIEAVKDLQSSWPNSRTDGTMVDGWIRAINKAQQRLEKLRDDAETTP